MTPQSKTDFWVFDFYSRVSLH